MLEKTCDEFKGKKVMAQSGRSPIIFFTGLSLLLTEFPFRWTIGLEGIDCLEFKGV